MNWDYIAGFFDGEGSAFLNNKKDHLKRQPIISISQKDKRPLLEIQKFLFENGIMSKIRKHSSDIDTLGITRPTHSIKFLKIIKDKIIVKREKADELINYWETYIPKYPLLNEFQKEQIENLMKVKVPYKDIKIIFGLRSTKQIEYLKRIKNIPNYREG